MNDEKELRPEDINPFASDESLTWADELAQSGFGRSIIPHEPKYESEENLRTNKSKAILIRAADIPPEKIEWLWPDRIALGKITVISGDPGLGKSLLAETLAAYVSKAHPWPISGEKASLGDAILLSAEDDPADTIRPRLDAAEADCNRVHIFKAVQDTAQDGDLVRRTFSLKKDLLTLETALHELPDCKLVVIDPVSAYLDGTDSHNNADIRGLLTPLSDLVSRYKVAIVLVNHLNKSGFGSALYRSMGSLAFVAAARSVYTVTKDRNNPERRLFIPTKSNIAKDMGGLAYSIMTAENGAPVIAWELEPVTITADEALMQPDTREEQVDADWAEVVLNQILADGPKAAKEVKKEATEAGLTDKQLRRAQKKLGIEPRKIDFNSGWVWSLPKNAEDAQDTPPKKEGTLDTFMAEEHLRDQ